MKSFRAPFDFGAVPDLQQADDTLEARTIKSDTDAPYVKAMRLKQMAKDFRKPVQDIFFTPGIDTGMTLVARPNWMWRARSRGRVAGVSVSAFDGVRSQIMEHCNTFLNQRSFKAAIEFNTLPVVVEDAAFEGSFMSVRGRWVLTGAAGTRLRNLMARDNAERRPDFDDQLVAHFETLQQLDTPAIPMATPQDRPLDLVLDCRNAFNFYHFTTETLPQLCSYYDLPNPGRIKIHSRSKEVKGFIQRLVDRIFPDIADKVDFLRSPKKYQRAYSILNTRHLYGQCGDTMMPSLNHLATPNYIWKDRAPIRTSQSVLAMNGFDTNLARLREKALEAIKGRDTSHLPKRFWVSRATDGARQRDMAGEAELIEALKARGFEVVYLEKMDPLDQIAMFHNAEIMMSYHGAAFANMLYAGKDTHCIEIGNLHTCLFRWQDFTPHVHVSGCRYFNMFADLNEGDPANPPEMRSLPNRPVALLDKGHAQVLRFVDALSGQTVVPSQNRDLIDIAELLDRGECWTELMALIANHPDVFEASPETHKRLANAYEGLGHLQIAFRHLQKVWESDESRPFVLERLALLAVRIGDGQYKLRNRHAQLFPERHDAFMKRFRRAKRLAKEERGEE